MFKSIIPITFSLLLAACWQRQDHPITGPEWPHYTVSGYTVDLDDTTAAIGCTPIQLTAKAVLYDMVFDPVTIVADSNGFFQIDTVYPGIYVITADRGGYAVLRTQFVLGHADLACDLQLPKPLVNDYFNFVGGSSNPKFAWALNDLWLLTHTQSLRLRDGIIPVVRRYSIEYEAGAPKLNSSRYDYLRVPYSTPTGFEAIGNMFYWHYGGLIVLCARESQTIFDFSIADSFRVQDPLYDLAWDGHGFWSTFGFSLQYRGNDLASAEESWNLGAGTLGPLTYGREALWSYDKDHLLLRIDVQDKSVYRYRPIDVDSGAWITVHDMDFGPGEHLWVSDRTRGRFFIFDTALRRLSP